MGSTENRHPIRFGVQAAPQHVSWAELREVGQEVEALLQQIPRVQTLAIKQRPTAILAGDVAAIHQQVQAYLDSGIIHLILALRRPEFFDREGLPLFATEVMPTFRSTV